MKRVEANVATGGICTICTVRNTQCGVSQTKLLFGQRMRTKRPELNDVHVIQKVHDRDSEQKIKSKSYAHTSRGVTYSEVLPGDQVQRIREKR